MSSKTKAAIAAAEEVAEELEFEEQSEDGLSLLALWSDVLANVEAVREQGVDMALAGRIVSQWPQISFQEVSRYHEYYHDLLLRLRDILSDAIKENPGAADFTESDDIAENHAIYKQLVIDWNILLDREELAWDVDSADSHITYAAVIDARTFLFNRNGFAGHLDARGFTLSTEEITEAILAAREEK